MIPSFSIRELLAWVKVFEKNPQKIRPVRTNKE